MNFPNFQMNTANQLKQKTIEMVNQEKKQMVLKCLIDIIKNYNHCFYAEAELYFL